MDMAIGRLVLAAGALSAACWAAEVRIAKGDYEAAVTEHGLEAKFRGITFICANHVYIWKPQWKGALYTARNLHARDSAKVVAAGDSILVSDAAPEIGARIRQEIRLDEAGLLISLTLSIERDIEPSPCEFAAAVFPAELFAGKRCGAAGLLGGRDWQVLPADKPKETRPGTKQILRGVQRLEVEGDELAVSIECLEGPTASFFDMRSRSYPAIEKNYWLLYPWRAGRGEMVVRTRVAARPVAAQSRQTPPRAPVVLAGDERHELRAIAVPADAHEVEKAAAAELQQYLVKMNGREIPLRTLEQGARPARGAVFVGSARAAHARNLIEASLLKRLESDDAGCDAFAVRSRAGNVTVAGANHRGTVYGVYRLLEKAGCTFYSGELEAIPDQVEIPGPFTVVDGAAFEWRAMLGTTPTMKCTLSPGEWKASVAGVDVPKMMAIPKGGFWHHTMAFILPPEDLVEKHPGWLALIDGKRAAVDPARQQYCLAAPGLLQAMTNAVLQWVADDPDRLYYPVHYGDVVRFCECEACKALCEEKGSLTDAVVWFDNQIAGEVARKHPGKFVTVPAYHKTRQPPVKVKPAANLLVIFCAITECQARPWSAPVNLELDVCKDLEAWIAAHPLGPKGIITFEYPTTYRYGGFPYPALYAFAENVRWYKQLGLRGVYICGLGRWKHLEHLYSYVIPRVLWNPGQDVSALVAEFCRGWYGDAWTPMRDYVELLHRTAMASACEGVMDCHAGPGQQFFKELCTPEFAARAYALFKAAEARAPDPFVKRRIQKEKWGALFLDLFVNGQKLGDLDPAPTELGVGRKTGTLQDFEKMAELLRLNRLFNRPWEIDHHRKFDLSSLVGFEPTRQPWWTCPKARELMADPARACERQEDAAEMAARHFVVLENERLKLVVVPGVGGRIWRLCDKRTGRDLLWRGRVPVSMLEKRSSPERHVNVGGYEEYAGEKFASPGWAEPYEVKIAADGRSLSLTGAPGDGLRLTRTIALAPDRPEVRIESVLENVSNQPRPDAMLRGHPQFVFPDGDRAVELGVRTADGNFRTAPFKSETFLTGPELPAGAWRVRFPKAGVSIVNEFEAADVRACYLYVGRDFLNLELFSPKKNLSPGEKLTFRHGWVIQHGE